MNQIIVKKNYDLQNQIKKIELKQDFNLEKNMQDLINPLRKIRMSEQEIKQAIVVFEETLKVQTNKKELLDIVTSFVIERVKLDYKNNIEDISIAFCKKIVNYNLVAIIESLNSFVKLPTISQLESKIKDRQFFYHQVIFYLNLALERKLADKKEEEERREILADKKTLKQRQDVVDEIRKRLKKVVD